MTMIMTMHRAPEFLIVGAQKAGTTSFYTALRQHPDIVAASTKEIHYFSQHFKKGLAWYLNHFPEREQGKISGEASPFYLFHPHAAARIASEMPDVKIIILLRDPVERAISHYHQQFRRGHETLAMMEAFTTENQRIGAAWKRLQDGKQVSGIKIQQCSYLKRGEYLEQLVRYEQHFPPEQILLLDSREFFEAPFDVLAKTFRFLGVDAGFRPNDLWPRKPGNYADTDAEVLAFLRTHFAPLNEALFRHLGHRYDWQ